MDIPSMDRDTPSPHDSTGHKLGNDKHGNNNGQIANSDGSNVSNGRRLRNNEQLKSTACPALSSRQASSSQHSGEGNSEGDFCSTSSGGREDKDKDINSSDPGNGKGSNGNYAKRQRQHTLTVRGALNLKQRIQRR